MTQFFSPVGRQLFPAATAPRATPVGCTVRAIATYQGPEGKFHRFKVQALDDSGPIGEGEHVRAIVSTERLFAGTAKRKVAS